MLMVLKPVVSLKDVASPRPLPHTETHQRNSPLGRTRPLPFSPPPPLLLLTRNLLTPSHTQHPYPPSRQGWTALHKAALLHRASVAFHLVGLGANMAIRTHVRCRCPRPYVELHLGRSKGARNKFYL